MNKKGGYMDIFLLIILAFVIVVICGVFIYMGNTIEDKLHEELDDKNMSLNMTVLIDDTMGKVNVAYASLRWISLFLIIGMIIAIFIGSYMVTSRPVFFVPYIFIVIIGVVLSASISNAYEMLRADKTIGPTFASFVGSNFLLANLPILIAVVGIGGGILMFTRIHKGEEQYYG